MVGSRGLGKLRGSRRVGACSSAPREAAPTDDYRGSDRGLTRGAPRVSGSRASLRAREPITSGAPRVSPRSFYPNVISRRPKLPNLVVCISVERL
jgi:hypothetical protein